jgi:hypothetical protein
MKLACELNRWGSEDVSEVVNASASAIKKGDMITAVKSR